MSHHSRRKQSVCKTSTRRHYRQQLARRLSRWIQRQDRSHGGGDGRHLHRRGQTQPVHLAELFCPHDTWYALKDTWHRFTALAFSAARSTIKEFVRCMCRVSRLPAGEGGPRAWAGVCLSEECVPFPVLPEFHDISRKTWSAARHISISNLIRTQVLPRGAEFYQRKRGEPNVVNMSWSTSGVAVGQQLNLVPRRKVQKIVDGKQKKTDGAWLSRFQSLMSPTGQKGWMCLFFSMI